MDRRLFGRGFLSGDAEDLVPAQLYDPVLPAAGIMHLFGEVGCSSVSPLMSYLHCLSAMPEEDRPAALRLFVNSDGGSFEDGFALVDTLLGCPVPVTTFCIGRACSIALPIFLAGSTRCVSQHSHAMFHGVSMDGVAGVAGSIRNIAAEADHCNKIMIRYICSRSKVSKAALRRAVSSGKDLYFYPEEMVGNGLAHYIGSC